LHQLAMRNSVLAYSHVIQKVGAEKLWIQFIFSAGNLHPISFIFYN
jgi:hypothetical protein